MKKLKKELLRFVENDNFKDLFVEKTHKLVTNTDERDILEITLKTLKEKDHPFDPDRFDFYETNAYSATALRTLGNKKYHFIIDDGSHKKDDILFVARNYYDLLANKGVLIIEDIPDQSFLKDLTELFTPEQQKGIRVFDVRESGRFDDLVWAIIKE